MPRIANVQARPHQHLGHNKSISGQMPDFSTQPRRRIGVASSPEVSERLVPRRGTLLWRRLIYVQVSGYKELGPSDWI